MKCFTVTAQGKLEHLAISHDPYPHVAIGEAGRGRKLSRVPLGQKDFPPEAMHVRTPCSLRGAPMFGVPRCRKCGIPCAPDSGVSGSVHPDEGFHEVQLSELNRASVIKTRAKGTILLVKETKEDNRALVVLAVKAGFRGSIRWSIRTGKKVPCEHGKTFFRHDVNLDACRKCGQAWIATEGYTVQHPEAGLQDEKIPLSEGGNESVTLLAEGRCAQGGAGRMGGHSEYLVILKPGARLEVRRGGRLYGADPVIHAYWDGEDLHVGTPDVVCQAAYEDEDGEEL